MNYSLENIPNSGKNIIIYMDISLKGEFIGKILIRLFRDVFPAGVENFIKIASGDTYKTLIKHNFPKNKNSKYIKQIKRTYDGCKFYHLSHNNYIISGDIYDNTGKNAGTIYDDNFIPADFGEFYYLHDTKGLLSLVPYIDENNNIYYDSTFMITLANDNPSNNLRQLNNNQIVIGQICGGINILDKINSLIKPFAGRKYPCFVISKCGIYNARNNHK